MHNSLSRVRHSQVSLGRRDRCIVLGDTFADLLIGRPVHVIRPVEGALVLGLNDWRLLRRRLLVVLPHSLAHSLLLRRLFS